MPWYLPARRELELPRRRPLELPARPRLERRPMLAVPTLVQSNESAYLGGGNVTVTLGAALTVGNLLVAIGSKADSNGDGGTTIFAGAGRAMTSLGHSQAHTNGGIMWLAYRWIVAGDSNTVFYPLAGGNVGIAAAEFAGLNPAAALGASATIPTNTGGPVMGIPIAPGAGYLVVCGMATRANQNAAGFTANGASSALSLAGVVHTGTLDYDNAMWCWGVGNITAGGTATGGSRNGGSPWAGIAQAFAPAVALSFVGDPGGAVW